MKGRSERRVHPDRWAVAVVISCAMSCSLSFLSPAQAQSKSPKSGPAKATAKPGQTTSRKRVAKELVRLDKEFIKATTEYKESLVRLRASYEKDVVRAEAELAKSKELFAAGLIAKNVVEAGEAEVARQKGKVAEVDSRMAGADSQIAEALLESEAVTKLGKSRPVPRGGLVRTTALIRYNGGGGWALSDTWKVQQFFLNTFSKQLPIAVFGQGAIHDRWRLDHRNALDISLHPDGAEGQALMGFLRANGIPFLAFRQAIPGTATGPHIHIGRPSHRY